jgi:uncharacterized membrane protein
MRMIQRAAPRSSFARQVADFLLKSLRFEWMILLLAGVIRFWRLSYHSIWFDEAVSLQWASSAPSWTWQKTFTLLEDKHPPVYYLALHYWRELIDLVGLERNDVALRAFGSLLGVLTVVGVLLLVRRLSGRTIALIAGLLVAISPVLVWYSQELRMFQPATTALVWVGYCLLRAWQTDQRWQRFGWWVGLILSLEAALYSYLFSAFVLPAAGLTLIGLWLGQARGILRLRSGQAGQGAGGREGRGTTQRLFEGILVFIVATGLFLPLAYNAWVVNGEEGILGQAFANLGDNLWRLLRVFTIWRVDWPHWLINSTLILGTLLASAGCVVPPQGKVASLTPQLDRLWLALWIGVPLLIGNLLLITSATVFAEDRYFLFLAPFVLWAIARGVVMLDQRVRGAGWLTGCAVAGLLGLALPTLWTPAMQRENWRAAAEYITAYQRLSPGLPAAVVAHVEYTRRPLERYLYRQVSEEALPLFFPFGNTLTPDQVETGIAPPLQGIAAAGTATLWLTQSHLNGVDDQRLVETWLNQNFALITEQYPAGIKLSGYALTSRFDELPQVGEQAVYPAAELAPGIQLAACELLTPRLAAQEAQLHPPSGWVHVRLWWQAVSAISDDYMATAQMVGPEGVWGERLYRANEALRRWPTRTWAVGDLMRDEVDINLNPVTPPNVYPILIGVMDSRGQPVGERVECGQVEVIE